MGVGPRRLRRPYEGSFPSTSVENTVPLALRGVVLQQKRQKDAGSCSRVCWICATYDDLEPTLCRRIGAGPAAEIAALRSQAS